MKALKVVFFGTPEFARTALEAIINSKHQIVGIVTVPDKQAGRGQKLSESPVKLLAVEKNLSLFQPEKLKNEDFLSKIQELGADVFVVVAFRMMPKILFSMPRLGTFNLHASLLPDYRGAAPINYAIINGERTTGATTFFINENIDEGNILLQEKINIGDDETAGELHDRLMLLGADLILKTLDGLAEERLVEIPQPAVQEPKNAFKIFKENTRIDWNNTSENIHNFVRGMSPYPCAFTTLMVDGTIKSLKIFRGRPAVLQHDFPAGHIEISKDTFKIYTQNGFYEPLEVQPEGKKRMSTKDFLNGIRNFDATKMA